MARCRQLSKNKPKGDAINKAIKHHNTMRKEVMLQQFERRLLELECPQKKLRRRVEELGDHHDFLKRTGLKEGMTEEGAESQASRQLGDPIVLAETAADEARQASWWGRHPILGYILFPLLTLGPVFILSIFLMIGVVLSQISQQQFQGLFNGPDGMNNFRALRGLFTSLFGLHYLVLTIFALPFAWLARRSGAGAKWGATACLVYAAQGMFLHLEITPRNNPFVYSWSPNLLGGAGPLLIAAAGFWWQWRRTNRLPELPANVKRRLTGVAALVEKLQTPLGSQRPSLAYAHPVQPKGPGWKKALRTPTYWVITGLIVIMFSLMLLAKSNNQRRQNMNQARKPDLRGTVWPEERKAVEDQVLARQSARDTLNEATIDLGPYINTDLSEATDAKKGSKDNNLLELPRGTRVYGGVPFNVQGRIQLMGRGLEQWQRIFPERVKGIRIGRKCAKIYLFHGENCAQGWDVRGAIVASLVLHYADGSQQAIHIKSGEHLLDWCGPLYSTQVAPEQRTVSSPDSELAWVGSNPWVKHSRADYSLRLYKSTFANPQPDLEISTIDYTSTMTQAAPFLVALTVE